MVASQSVIKWCSVSLPCRHSLHVGSISGWILDWKYARLLWPVMALIHVLNMCIAIFKVCLGIAILRFVWPRFVR